MILKAMIVGFAVLASHTVHANIVDLNGFRMSPFVLVKKQDFTYSSGSK